MAVSGIIFDLDDTLYADQEARDVTLLSIGEQLARQFPVQPEQVRHTVRETAREVWYNCPLAEYSRRVGMSSWEGLWAQFTGMDADDRQRELWVEQYRRQAWQRSLEKLGIAQDGLAEQLASTFWYERRHQHRLFPDTLGVLKQLDGRYRLGLLTNGAVALQNEKIDGADLRHWFEAIVISGEIGIGKPHRQVFDLMLDRMQMGAGEVIMIGNSLPSDVAGAHEVGIKAVWVNREGTPNDSVIRPDCEVRSLTEIDNVLTGRQRDGT